jgi:hypothetical protein
MTSYWHTSARGLVVDVASLRLHPLVVVLEHLDRFAMARASLCAPTHSPLGFGESPLRLPVVPRIVDHLAISVMRRPANQRVVAVAALALAAAVPAAGTLVG